MAVVIDDRQSLISEVVGQIFVGLEELAVVEANSLRVCCPDEAI